MTKGKDLKVGMLTTEGLILEIDGHLDFYEGKPNLTYICIQDAYYGPLIGERFPEKDYKILHEEGTPGYREVLTRMMKECMQHAGDKLRDTARIFTMLEGTDGAG